MLALNALMPIDTVFFESEIVDEDFHVQYSTKGKWYRYVVDQHRFTDPFNRFYTGHHNPASIRSQSSLRCIKIMTFVRQGRMGDFRIGTKIPID